MAHKHEEVLSPEDKAYIQEKFNKELVEEVLIKLITSDGCEYCSPLESLLRELEELAGGKLILKVSPINDTISKILGVNRGPVVLMGSRGEVRYTGAPFGEEGWAFIETISLVSSKRHGLDKYEEDLRSLDKLVRIETIVTPSCPYCPYAVLTANRIAVASRGKVISDTIEAYEFPEIAEKWHVTVVPTVILSVEEPYSGDIFTIGVPKEEQLIRAILKLGIEE